MLNLSRRIRSAIVDGSFPDFVRTFVRTHYPEQDFPTWVVEALLTAGIELDPSSSTTPIDPPNGKRKREEG